MPRAPAGTSQASETLEIWVLSHSLSLKEAQLTHILPWNGMCRACWPRCQASHLLYACHRDKQGNHRPVRQLPQNRAPRSPLSPQGCGGHTVSAARLGQGSLWEAAVLAPSQTPWLFSGADHLVFTHSMTLLCPVALSKVRPLRRCHWFCDVCLSH